MAITVVGSVAYDTIETPAGKRERCLGGAATYFSLAASYFTDVRVIAVVGEDFGRRQQEVFESHKIDTRGIEHTAGKSFFWEGSYLTTETRSTCPYCAVSCGVIIYTLGDKAKNVTPQVIHVEGDPDHPINRGTLCPKGASLEQDILNPRRLLKPQVRPAGSGTSGKTFAGMTRSTRSLDKTKKTRDETFVEKDANGKTVNRCEGIAFMGGCTDTNEFNYLVVKSMRSMGVCYLENQARV